jgi:cyclic dehypoxanthinyl futalosine synthase
VRRKIGLGKCDAEEWLTTMYVAHTLGMFTSATMMFGHIEGFADRIHHMDMVRRWQDKALQASDVGCRMSDVGKDTAVGHYKAFISWPFQRENTPLGRVRNWGDEEAERAIGAEFPGDIVARLNGTLEGKDLLTPEQTVERVPQFGRRVRMSGAIDYLRTQAVSRLFLDNVYSIGASWVTMGPHIGQVALAFGANDMGSVMMEENVVSSAGTTYCLDEAVLCRLIREAGFTPAQRDNRYDLIRVHPAGTDAPDLVVSDWSTHRAKKTHQQAPVVPKVKMRVTVSASR